MNGSGAHAARLFASAFLSVLFLQSSIDKLLDRRGHLAAFRSRFERSFLRRFSKALLTVFTLAELGAGVISATGFLRLFLDGDAQLALVGAMLATLCTLALFATLRLVKDEGAGALQVPYFLTCLAALLLLGH